MIDVGLAFDRLCEADFLLSTFESDIRLHLRKYNKVHRMLLGDRSVVDFANGYMYFGFQRTDKGITFREWLPEADAAWIFGDFNSWDRYEYPLKKNEFGVFEITFDKSVDIQNGSYVKLSVMKDGEIFERVPAYIRYASLDQSTAKLVGRVWLDDGFLWCDDEWRKRRSNAAPLIYEAHIGMSSEREGIGTYREFADVILPWIKRSGYNTVQLMAIAEHPYYASFGYQVSSFFAPSHRFGTPSDLKYLINKAHTLGLCVIMDVVHSHASANLGEGLDRQDGSEDTYFLRGNRGNHPAWGTKLFDYSKYEVLHFLLSNLKYWMSEFHFDGFRFDGVTSMLYEDHALGTSFTDYNQYFSTNTNIDARVYLMLANELVHQLDPLAITISEDMSGMPGMCLPIDSAGFGFDYRLAMGTPDLWIRLIEKERMDTWRVSEIYYELTRKRRLEKSIAYAESHDQALVGDKTIMFRLADAEMYYGMEKSKHTERIDLAIDMHKLIRFLTLSLSNGGYLNFMGNEFGHPEWIDFPREGNGWSYHYARRQWSLVHNKNYKYEWLSAFDRAMLEFSKKHKVCGEKAVKPRDISDEKSIIVFRRGDLIYAFNLHPTRSDDGVFVNTGKVKKGYKVIFSSDDSAFGGQERIDKNYIYHPEKQDRRNGFLIYLPARCAIVLKKI